MTWLDTAELPRALAEPLELARACAESSRPWSDVAALIALPADWRARAGDLRPQLAALAAQPSAVRRGFAVLLAGARTRDELPAAYARLVTHLLAWHSPACAAAYAQLQHAEGGAASAYRDAIPASEAALRRAIPTTASEAPPRAPAAAAAAPRADTRAIDAAVARARDVLASTQAPDGSWHGDYGGPLFLLPMYVGTCAAAGLPIEAATRDGMIAYFSAHQNPDGGWGLDVEGDSLAFTTVLCYTALRLLGVPRSDPRAEVARAWMHPRGGALGAASWGKFFLALLGLYGWDGVAPTPPELWLLPEAAPIHPSRMWCHARMVYLPMSYLHGTRAVFPIGAIADELREELYAEPYGSIDWRAARDRIAPEDRYAPHGPGLRAAHAVMRGYDRIAPAALRRRALERVLAHVEFEDRATDFLCIGPINKLYDLLVWQHARPGGAEVAAHVAKLPAYLWSAPDGVKMQGYNSSQLWDTAFAVQALAAAGDAQAPLARAAAYVEANQIVAEPPNSRAFYRTDSLGGWPFSTRAHGWPITDCTAEGLLASRALDAWHLADPITPARRQHAVDRLLGWQNPDGGWASYENTRGPRWLEALNPADVFGEIMIDRSYVECTSASMVALAASGDPRAPAAITRGLEFLLAAQRPDGGFEGSWGVCFTYGAWFAIRALATVAPGHRLAARARAASDRACAFLLAHQRADGAWGETVEACRRHRYIQAERGQAVMTSWALLALALAGRGRTDEVARGAAWLVAHQRADGRWPDERIAGVFNHTCAIHYDAYLRVFPLWALAAVRDACAAA